MHQDGSVWRPLRGILRSLRRGLRGPHECVMRQKPKLSLWACTWGSLSQTAAGRGIDDCPVNKTSTSAGQNRKFKMKFTGSDLSTVAVAMVSRVGQPLRRGSNDPANSQVKPPRHAEGSFSPRT